MLQPSPMYVQFVLDAVNDINEFLNGYNADKNFKEIVESSRLIQEKFVSLYYKIY